MGKGAIFLRRAGQAGIGIGILSLILAGIIKDSWYITWGVIILLASIGSIRYSTYINERNQEERQEIKLRDEKVQQTRQQNPSMTSMEWIDKEYKRITKSRKEGDS